MLKRRWARWILIFGVWTLLGALSAVRVDEIKLNAPLDDSRFNKPAAP
jgi:hypothetical protein